MDCAVLTCPRWQPEMRAWTTIIELDTSELSYVVTATGLKVKFITLPIVVNEEELLRATSSELLNTGEITPILGAITQCIIRNIKQRMRSDWREIVKLDSDELKRQLLKL